MPQSWIWARPMRDSQAVSPVARLRITAPQDLPVSNIVSVSGVHPAVSSSRWKADIEVDDLVGQRTDLAVRTAGRATGSARYSKLREIPEAVATF